jgi:VCBS repeat-containing protein
VLGNDTDPDGDPLTVTGATVDPPRAPSSSTRRHPHLHPGRQRQWPGQVTYTISDGKGGTTATATINVAPAADTAVLGTGTGTVKEDTRPDHASGTLSIVDPDAGEAAFQPQTNVPGTYGSFTLDAAGHWTYTLDNSQARRPGPEGRRDPSETFTVTSVDGTATTVTITVTGTNDGPSPRPTRPHQRRQPVTFAVLGNDTDPDGDTLTVTGATVDPPRAPSPSIPTAPSPSPRPPTSMARSNHLHHQRRKGGTTTATATVNIAPIADPAILGTGTGTVKEDTPAQTSASGTLSIIDPDAGQAAFQPQTNVAGTYGTFPRRHRRRLDLHRRQHPSPTSRP